MRLGKLPGEEGCVESCIPCARALTKSIERLMEFLDEMLRSLLNETKRPIHVHGVVHTMREGSDGVRRETYGAFRRDAPLHVE